MKVCSVFLSFLQFQPPWNPASRPLVLPSLLLPLSVYSPRLPPSPPPHCHPSSTILYTFLSFLSFLYKHCHASFFVYNFVWKKMLKNTFRTLNFVLFSLKRERLMYDWPHSKAVLWNNCKNKRTNVVDYNGTDTQQKAQCICESDRQGTPLFWEHTVLILSMQCQKSIENKQGNRIYQKNYI